MANPLVGIIMGSDSDMDIMAEASKILDEFGVVNEMRIVSAHRTPDVMTAYAQEAYSRGLKVIIAGAGGSAHLPGMTASETLLPVLAVPIKRNPEDHEALWSSIKMPPGVPLSVMPENGAKNAGLMAVEILGLLDSNLAQRYAEYRKKMHDEVVKIDTNVQSKGNS